TAFIIGRVERAGIGMLPKLLAGDSVETKNRVDLVRITKGEKASFRYRHRGEANPDRGFPQGFWTFLGPLKAPAFFLGNAIEIRSAPVWPIAGCGLQRKAAQREE